MTADAQATSAPPVTSATGLWQRARRTLLEKLWYLHPPIHLTITLAPVAALAALQTAARPSTERLHLRNVFAQGRRYYLQGLASGEFLITTNTRQSGRYAHRTAAITLMTGTFERMSDLTRVTLRSRMKLSYLLDVLWLPTFMAGLLLVLPWHVLLVGGLIAAFYILSWAGHRYNAALEAYEMAFFVEKAFEEFLPPLAPPIEPGGAQVVYDLQRDFGSAWEHFYQQVINPDHDSQEPPHV